MPLKMLLLILSTGRFSMSASLLSTVGSVGEKLGGSAPKVERVEVGEYASMHRGVQNPHRPADLVGFRSPPNFSRCEPFCHVRLSMNSKRRVSRPCGALKFGPTAGMLEPKNVKTFGSEPATQGAVQSAAM